MSKAIMFNCHSGRRTTYISFSIICVGWKTRVIVGQVACLQVTTCVICGWQQLCRPIGAIIMRQIYSADKFALTISFIPRSVMSKYEYWYLQHLSISPPCSVKMCCDRKHFTPAQDVQMWLSICGSRIDSLQWILSLSWNDCVVS